MAGAGYKLFNTGDVLTAAQVNTYLMQQTVMVFASSAARTSALSGVLAEGMVSYLQDTNTLEVYDGSAWVGATGDITGLTAGTGISISSATGPVPTITSDVATTFDAKGDLVVGTGADTFSKLTVGANGESIVADSSATTGLRWQTAANSNSIVNGGMDFWQRGTSFSAPASNSYIADRWQYQRSTVTGSALSRQSSGLDGIQYALRFGRDSGSTNVTSFFLGHNLETSESIRFQNKTVVISFYARKGANYSGGNLTVYMATGTGTDQNILTSGFTSQTAVINTTTAFTTSWERYSFTASIGASATQIGFYFGWTPSGTAGANDWVEITGVQLEVGSVATTFKRAGGTLAGELAAAMRYYQRFGAHDGITTSPYAFYGLGYTYNTTTLRANIELKTRMRIAPTTVEFSALTAGRLDGNNFAVSAVTSEGNNNTDTIASIDCTVATTTTNTLHRLIGNNSTSTFLAFSAEL